MNLAEWDSLAPLGCWDALAVPLLEPCGSSYLTRFTDSISRTGWGHTSDGGDLWGELKYAPSLSDGVFSTPASSWTNGEERTCICEDSDLHPHPNYFGHCPKWRMSSEHYHQLLIDWKRCSLSENTDYRLTSKTTEMTMFNALHYKQISNWIVWDKAMGLSLD